MTERNTILRRIGLVALVSGGLFLGLAACLAAYLITSFHTAISQNDGAMKLAGLRATVQIFRDERDIPHIRAQNTHDMFFAQGYTEGSDRLFQFDLTRHFVYGRLAEWFGGTALPSDQRSRNIDVRGIVARQWGTLSPESKAELQAFADGVNAAIQTQPLPFEYRLLFLKPEKWEAPDSLAVGFATVLALADGYRDVLAREDTYRAYGAAREREQFPLSDPKYDVPIVGSVHHHDSDLHAPLAIFSEPKAQASNEWAVGATHSLTGRALLANDPHLDLSIPGIWYLVDISAPGFHAAGASLAGTPGIILGHNDAIAWGATNGTVAALSVFHVQNAPESARVTERFGVRLGGTHERAYYRDARGFYVTGNAGRTYLVVWDTYSKPGSPLSAFDGLDRAHSMKDGLAALSKYPGPTQNFVLASIDGTAAYTLAGRIPNDPVWAQHAHEGPFRAYPALPFDVLPHVAPSRNAVVFTANNRMYGDGYPYRLSATFAPPYRAYEIWRLLHARKKYDVAYFSKMQNDTYSVAEREFAQFLLGAQSLQRAQPRGASAFLNALKDWDGHFTPDSKAATGTHAVRIVSRDRWPGNLSAQLQLLRTSTHHARRQDEQYLLADLSRASQQTDLLQPWGTAGAVPILNPLHSLGVPWLDGATLPGNGDNYTIHAQNSNFNQSFRAVWDVGNWDAGGIVIPAGESGEPGSVHYADLTPAYQAGSLVPLPFSDAAVKRHTARQQTLLPTP
ncbi:MAG: penicillin acylase family protein [Candidatus Eremiobacteraeota bacterium]|nr:penicillin acylase family protein [Candidatus Eremiobacteraeota bacterium]